MRHGLTFKTSNKQLNRPSSAYRGIFRQIKHTYFIFFKHIVFILRIKTTDPFFFSLPIDANSSQTLVISNPFFSMHGTTFPKKCFHFIFEINQSKYFNLNIFHQCMRVIHISLHGLFDWGYQYRGINRSKVSHAEPTSCKSYKITAPPFVVAKRDYTWLEPQTWEMGGGSVFKLTICIMKAMIKKNHYVKSTTEFSVPNQLLYVCWLSIQLHQCLNSFIVLLTFNSCNLQNFIIVCR